ncbi:helix-turn-helix domain-containing protein [Portibacter lacus]|nr:AraC family transcriptional regulator [Portibacter lacus]
MIYSTKNNQTQSFNDALVNDNVELIFNLSKIETSDFLNKLKSLINDHFQEDQISFTIHSHNPIKAMEFSLSQKYGAKIIEVLEIQDEWLAAITIYIIKNLSNHQFSGEFLAEAMNLSSRQLRRKIKAINGRSTQEFVNDIRFALAKEIINTEMEVDFQTISKYLGFGKKSYFIDKFESRFGYKPPLV